MRQITTLEEREKALAWIIEQANHPLDPVNNDPKTAQMYEYLTEQVQNFNATHFKELEYEDVSPVEEPPQREAKGGWLD